MIKERFFCILISLVLTGCGSVSIKRISPEPYSRASDYAYDVLKKTTCMGNVDSLLFKPAVVDTDSHGVLSFVGNHSETHCNSEDFRDILESYCQIKGGVYRGDWCVKNDEPVFYINKFTIKEKSDVLSEQQWQQVARSTLGYVSRKESELELLRNDAKSALLLEQRKRRNNSSVNASVGDFICREDLQSNGQYNEGPVYYGAYIEAKQIDRLKLRVVWHGRKNLTIVNSQNQENPIVWESPKGWFSCDRRVIQSLP